MTVMPLTNRTIWKLALRATDMQEIEVPAGTDFLCAREQFERICVWFRCDPRKSIEKRTIAIVGTGNAAPGDDGLYLGTASLSGGQLMFHVFEIVTKESAA